ncbi:MAG: Peptidyl-tRNA hydrolase ArfB [Planctomycetes bacterium ADurb.Bin401]|nr:MAG: Peptidyl-tRNA hydrolase ArfB [Planctomycetes bacterium ADurb.Bin401]
MSRIQIPENELTFKASRSSGPGGQNVNKLNTKVAVSVNIETCSFLNEEQKKTILKKFSSRLTKDNRLIVESQRFRTQNANRDFAFEKLRDLIEAALVKPKKRKPTKPSFSSVEKRLKNKKRRSEIKSSRGKNFLIQ